MLKVRGLEGDLFDQKSNACRASLDTLRDAMIEAGFLVNRRSAREATLKAYLSKDDKYPLLNPRFQYIEELETVGWPPDCIAVAVFSKDSTGRYAEALEAFQRAPGVFFHKREIKFKGYQFHGNFFIHLPFVGDDSDSDDILDSDDYADSSDTALAEGNSSSAETAAQEEHAEGASDDDLDSDEDWEVEIDFAELTESFRAIHHFLSGLTPPQSGS